MLLRHSERSEESSHFLHRILVILLPLLRHFERSEKSSYFSFRNTRLHWMFRGYASQHDAKRFGVRMTAKTFRALVILLPLLRHSERSEKSSYFSFRNTRLYWMFRG